MRAIRTFTRSAVALLVLAGLSSVGASSLLRLEPTRTRVGIASVHLEIGDLRMERDRLVGTYEVKIPLAPSRNDRGLIAIDLESSLDEVIVRKGTVTGLGLSLLDGRVHPVTCEFGGDRLVRITIDTGDRLLDFKTRFR